MTSNTSNKTPAAPSLAPAPRGASSAAAASASNTAAASSSSSASSDTAAAARPPADGEARPPSGRSRAAGHLGFEPLGFGISPVWHRMGDTGYLDADGRLWFCGRKAERVATAAGTLFTEPCEQVFRTHPAVARCALIGLGPPGAQTPAIVIQPADKKLVRPSPARAALAAALRALAAAHPHTTGITRFYFHPDFPVDVRHNAKIHRLTLAAWAARKKAGC